MKMRRYLFVVRGRGTFPFDMLRYDSCFPFSSADAALMESHEYEQREVRLVTHTTRVRWYPEAGRWSSFLWTVVKCEELT